MGDSPETDDRPSIPTIRKDKIGHLWSYPITAGALATALDGVPQYDMFTVRFRAPNYLPTALHTEVVEAEYFCRGASVFDARGSERPGTADWRLVVTAVPRDVRHQIAACLAARGLAALRAALISCGTFDGREGQASFKLVYKTLEESISLEQGLKVLPARQR